MLGIANREHRFSLKEEKTVSQPSKRQREEPEHQTIVINTPSLNGNSSTLVQETL